LRLHLPEPPVRQLELTRNEGVWEAQFIARHGWTYLLERSSDLQEWETVATDVGVVGRSLTLADPTETGVTGFYRVRAEKP
jgi:hypothetical protein